MAAILYVVPELARDLAATRSGHLTRRKVMVMVMVMVVMVLVLAATAGAAALAAPHVATRGQAIGAGVAIQAGMRGVLGAIQHGIRPDQGPADPGSLLRGSAVPVLSAQQGG